MWAKFTGPLNSLIFTDGNFKEVHEKLWISSNEEASWDT
jgi:hypothetical protein